MTPCSRCYPIGKHLLTTDTITVFTKTGQKQVRITLRKTCEHGHVSRRIPVSCVVYNQVTITILTPCLYLILTVSPYKGGRG